MSIDVKSSLASTIATVSIAELPARLRALKKRIIANRQQCAESCWRLASSVEEARVVLEPHKGAFQSLLDDVGVTKSHAYALCRAFRLAQNMPPEVLKNFSGPTALITLSSNEKAVAAAEKLAAEGQVITVEKARTISGEFKPKASKPATVKVVLPGIATLIGHCVADCRDEDRLRLQKYLEMVADKIKADKLQKETAA